MPSLTVRAFFVPAWALVEFSGFFLFASQAAAGIWPEGDQPLNPARVSSIRRFVVKTFF
jgi:hypothetical protein